MAVIFVPEVFAFGFFPQIYHTNVIVERLSLLSINQRRLLEQISVLRPLPALQSGLSIISCGEVGPRLFIRVGIEVVEVVPFGGKTRP